MALIKCPECGKDVSSKSNICIHCGFPISSLLEKQGMVTIKYQSPPIDIVATTKSQTQNIVTTSGHVLCTIEPGRVSKFTIDKDTEIYAIPAYGSNFRKEKCKTNCIYLSPNKNTRIQLAYVKVKLGLAYILVLNEIDVIDSD